MRQKKREQSEREREEKNLSVGEIARVGVRDAQFRSRGFRESVEGFQKRVEDVGVVFVDDIVRGRGGGRRRRRRRRRRLVGHDASSLFLFSATRAME